MFNIDIDKKDLGINWELDAIMIYYNLWQRYQIRPRVEVSAGLHGVHLSFPGLTFSPSRDVHERHLWDCPGHASLVWIRGGADVIFSNKKGKRVIPVDDIFRALSIIRGCG